jgi:hypothetical protein
MKKIREDRNIWKNNDNGDRNIWKHIFIPCEGDITFRTPTSIFSRDGDMASTQNLLIICKLNYRHVIRKFIHPRVSYSPLALPSGNMILLSEYIFIFPSPACNKCIICKIDMKTIQGDRKDSDNVVVEKWATVWKMKR